MSKIPREEWKKCNTSLNIMLLHCDFFFSVTNSESEHPINFTQDECTSTKAVFFPVQEDADEM